MKKTFRFSRRSLTDGLRPTQKAVEERLLNDTSIFMFDGLRVLVSLLCILALCASISAQDWKIVHDGVDYAHVDHKIGSDPVKINLLRLDLKKVRLDVHHALDSVIGTETTSSIATRHGAVAAINAGFFRIDKSEFAGDAAGILMIDGRLLSESTNDRATVILINLENKTHVLFGHYSTETWIRFEKAERPTAISGINRERKNGEGIIYESLKQKAVGQMGDVELWLGKCSRRQSESGSDRFIDCKNVEVVRDDSDAPKLKNPQFVLSLDKEFVQVNAVQEKLIALERNPNSKILVGIRIKDGKNCFAFTKDVDITNGVPQLIKNGKIDITWQQEKASKSFAEMRHPRTAVAKFRDGKFLMVTVDGRQPGISVGMTLQELAEYILSLGATDAMNLDGGGSTTMFLDGKVLNTPSDKEGERKVSDAVLVTLRKNARPSRR
ncbi:MAG: phosphodiester glycosidase family protein [Acidobacteriota bacterium]